MNPHNQHVIEYFNQTHDDYRLLWGIDRHLGLHCGFYDETHARHDLAIENMNRVLAETAQISAGDRVLDAGCGIGGSALWLAKHIDGVHVTGVNINEKQLAIAHQLAHKHQVESYVEFHVADLAETGLPDATFDVVWALESMCYVASKQRFLEEAYRILKPGGRLIIADGFLTKERLISSEQKIVDAWCAGWAIPNVLTIQSFNEQLSETGFQNIRFRDVTRHVAPSSQRIFATTLLLFPLGVLLYWTGLRSQIQTRGIASGYYQYVARRKGLGIYGICYAEK